MSKEELDLLSVRIKLFAISRELVGKDEVTVKLAKQITVGDLRKMILQMYPALSTRVHFMIAVNHRVADDSMTISQTDEVAILPPVSGGSR